MEGMVGEKGLLPERSEWFRSITLIGPGGRFVSKKLSGDSAFGIV
jgi:hypothetical protein